MNTWQCHDKYKVLQNKHKLRIINTEILNNKQKFYGDKQNKHKLQIQKLSDSLFRGFFAEFAE